MEFTDDVSSFTCYHFKPQLKTLAPNTESPLEDPQRLVYIKRQRGRKELDSTGWLKLNLSIGEIKLAPRRPVD